MTDEQVARAFSEHRFREAYPRIADNVRWNVVGAAVLPGKQVLMRNCDSLIGDLDGIDVEFTTFRVIAGADGTVVIDSVATYRGDEPATVASCDIDEFDDGMVTAITSYTVEVDGPRTS